jgi:hypothetical protein
MFLAADLKLHHLVVDAVMTNLKSLRQRKREIGCILFQIIHSLLYSVDFKLLAE